MLSISRLRSLDIAMTIAACASASQEDVEVKQVSVDDQQTAREGHKEIKGNRKLISNTLPICLLAHYRRQLNSVQ